MPISLATVLITKNNTLIMKTHIKIYMDAFDYDVSDFIFSEISKKQANDIHHIECKGMGGNPSKDKDRIENLQALTRVEHLMFGDKKRHMCYLLTIHKAFLISKKIPFDLDYINSKIEKYYEWSNSRTFLGRKIH